MQEKKSQILLSELKAGQRAIIVDFEVDDMPLKLLEMGVVPGNEILVKRFAPLKDPMHIEIRGSEMALRKDEALHVWVELIEFAQAV